MNFEYLIVGAGFAGSVCARKLAEAGKSVLLIDKRSHIGGNAYDVYDANGILIHPYGPHIFHTNSKMIIEFLSQYTNWRFYEHRVLASDNGKMYPIPINRKTINMVFGKNLAEKEVSVFLDELRVIKNEIKNSEDVVLNSVGELLCDKFFRGYTKKQWGLDLKDLSAGVASRIPTRTDDDDRYFSDTYQFIPVDGYSSMFNKMLDHDKIKILLNSQYSDIKEKYSIDRIIYTGPIDEYYDYVYGKLPYRSLNFLHEHFPSTAYLQDVGTVNYPNEHPYTRITEFKHITGQISGSTSIVKEYPTESGEPYYPIPTKQNAELYSKYLELADNEKSVFFVGRLAQYKYYNMDQVVAASLKLCSTLIE